MADSFLMYDESADEVIGVDASDILSFIGLFTVDINGDLMPVEGDITDQYYELDANDDIMPRV